MSNMSGTGSSPVARRPLTGIFKKGLRDRATMGALFVLMAGVLLTALAYLPGLAGPLFLDDLPQLGGLIAESATDPVILFGNYVISGSGPLGRPVSMLTFIMDAIAHGPDTWWWKYLNLSIHLISGLLLGWFSALIATAVADRADHRAWLFGALVAAVWLLHPLQVSTVLYTVQRMTGLATMFVLAGLVCYVKGRLIQDAAPLRGWLLVGAAFGVCLPLAALSKETGLLLPVYCSLVEVLVLRFRGNEGTRRPIRYVHGGLLGAYLLIGMFVLFNFADIVLEGYAARDFGLTERVLTQFRVLLLYLSQILLPVQRRMAFFHDDITASAGLLDPVTTLLSMVAIGALVYAAIRFRKTQPLFAFGVLFFFATHLLESTVFPLELMFEHRNYLGLSGVVIALVSLVPLVIRQQRAIVAMGAVVVLTLSAMTWQRAQTWSSPANMYVYMYGAHPESPRLNLIFSNIHANSGDFQRARSALERVGQGPGPAVHGLFLDCLEYGRVGRQAIAAATAGTEGIVDAHATSSLESLTGATLAGRCTVAPQGMLQLSEYLTNFHTRSVADSRSVLLTKAAYLEAIGETDAAVQSRIEAAAIDSQDALPLYLAAGALVRAERFDDARAMLTRAYEMEQGTRIQRKGVAQSLYTDVAAGFLVEGRTDEALSVYREAIQSMPRYASAYVALAEVALATGQHREAGAILSMIDERELIDIGQYRHQLERISDAIGNEVTVGQSTSGSGSD
jgi:hypothetical protein